MKRKLVHAVLGLILSAETVFCVSVYRSFHPGTAFISRSPAGSRVVDCVPAGFIDLSYHFRAHDLRASPFRPVIVGDLYWEERYFSGSIFWARDGSVAAASIVFYSDRREILACAYDFRQHRAIRSGFSGSPLNHTKDAEIRRLLDSRGGFTQHYLPEPKEL